MLQVELYNDNFVLTENDLKSKSLEILLSVDCNMRIMVDGLVFYDDCVCPLELYYHYNLWKKIEQKTNLQIDFVHFTEDNDKNPILAFINNGKDMWRIDSCYKKYDERKKFTKNQILDFFAQYEKQLLKHIS